MRGNHKTLTCFFETVVVSGAQVTQDVNTTHTTLTLKRNFHGISKAMSVVNPSGKSWQIPVDQWFILFAKILKWPFVLNF
jgi:hypothetical protein